MKLEFAVLGLLTLGSLWYMKKVDDAIFSTKALFENSVETIRRHEDRLVRVEEAVQDVPALRDDLREIKKILLAQGVRVSREEE